MKWDDNLLPYYNEKKILIHKYIYSVINTLKSNFSIEEITPPLILTHMQNDNNWDVDIFKTDANREWFVNEIKSNPHLIAFIISESEKVLSFPDMYDLSSYIYEKTITDFKSEQFCERIMKFIKDNPYLPHYYFSMVDVVEVEKDLKKFISNSNSRYKHRLSSIPQDFYKVFKLKYILCKYFNIQCDAIITANQKMLLTSKSHDFDISVSYWGNFPTFFENSVNRNKLLCILDEFSVYFLSIVDKELVKQFSSKDFLFIDEDSLPTNKQTAFYGFDKIEPFSFECIEKYLKIKE